MWHVGKHELEHLKGYPPRYCNFDQVYQRWMRSDTPPSLRQDGRIYLRNSMLNLGAGYEQCRININTGLSVIWTTVFGQVWPQRAEGRVWVHSLTVCTLEHYVNCGSVWQNLSCTTRGQEEGRFSDNEHTATLSETDPIENVARSWYTRRVFKKFQE